MAANLYGSGETSDDAQRKGMAGTAPVDKAKGDDAPKKDPVAALYWREIERYNRAFNDWTTEGENIENVYLDESRSANTTTRKFALLWANVETLKPAVYAKIPTILCGRRYKDRDPIGRTAAELMERASNTTFDLYGVNEVMKSVRDDRLLPGRGQAWVRYEAVIEQFEDTAQYDDQGPTYGKAAEAEMAQMEAQASGKAEPVMRERLKSEKACVDYINWKDFGHNVSGIWKDVWLVWRWVYKTEEEIAERFGADKAANLSYTTKSPAQGSGSSKDDPEDKCRIAEVWDKQRGRVSWMAEGTRTFLDTGAPPIDFMNFFPCPEPCFATKTTKSLITKADYCYYRDQAKEINDLTEKIHNLTKWLIVKGFVPGGPSSVADPIEEAIKDKSNSELFLQVDSMQEWTDRGGTAGLIDWLPVDKVIQALQAAINARAQLIQDVFQLTGISDILRGQTDPNETLGAQELKAQTGNRRLRNTKDEIARFARDLGALVCEVIAEKFEPQSIAEITGYKYQPQQMMQQPLMLAGPPQPMSMQQYYAQGNGRELMQDPRQRMMMAMGGQQGMPQQGMGHSNPGMDGDGQDEQLVFDDRHLELLRNDKMRSFRIEIETDSTIQPDENAEKASRTEMSNMAGQYLERAAKIIPVAPDLAPALGELLMFTVRGFRAGRGVEETLERSFAQLVKRVQQQANSPQPNPEIEKAKAELQIEAQRGQQEMQLEGQKAQAGIQLERQKAGAEIQIEREKAANTIQLETQKAHIDANLKVRQQGIDARLKSEQNRTDAQARVRDSAMRMASRIKPTSVN